MKYALVAIAALLLSACSMSQVRTITTVDDTQTTYSQMAQKEPLVEPAVTVEQSLLPPVEEPAPMPAEELVSRAQLECLARNMYFEARGEGSKGMIAVGYVTINRTHTAGFPDTICGVVHQGSPRHCQFSWYCDGRTDRIASPVQYEQALSLAKAVLARTVPNPVGRSVFFHNGRVKPGWRGVVFQCRIGGHRFYRKA